MTHATLRPYTVGMETITQRESVIAAAESAETQEELELAIVALAQLETSSPGDTAVQTLHRRLAERFANGIEPLEHPIQVEERVRRVFGMMSSG